LEGLEVTVKKNIEILENNPTLRLDAEFFKKEYLTLYKSLFSKPCVKLEVIASWITQGPNPKFVEDGIPCLTGRNINNGRVNYYGADFLSEEEYNNYKRFQLEKGDTLITLKGLGSIGKIGFVTESKKAIFSRDIGLIRPKGIDPGYVNAFILSKYGKKIINRGETGGTGQRTLATTYLKNIDIPRLSIEDVISNLIEESELVLKRSNILYAQAESLLLENLGLNNFVTNNDPLNIKSFKNSFDASGRLDAEYYQKKYEDLLVHIENHLNWKYLKDLTTYISNGNQPPYSENGTIKFFSQKWIGDHSIDYSFLTSDEEPQVDELFFKDEKNKPSLVNKGDILYYSVGANLGYCHNYLADEPIAVGSFINIIRADKTKINEIYLGVVLNSMVGRLQGEKEKSGMAQPYIYAKSLREFKIPILNDDEQREISDCIESGQQLRNQSEQLLETAKRAVEMAIEEGEARAMEWMESQQAFI